MSHYILIVLSILFLNCSLALRFGQPQGRLSSREYINFGNFLRINKIDSSKIQVGVTLELQGEELHFVDGEQSLVYKIHHHHLTAVEKEDLIKIEAGDALLILSGDHPSHQSPTIEDRVDLAEVAEELSDEEHWAVTVQIEESLSIEEIQKEGLKVFPTYKHVMDVETQYSITNDCMTIERSIGSLSPTATLTMTESGAKLKVHDGAKILIIRDREFLANSLVVNPLAAASDSQDLYRMVYLMPADVVLLMVPNTKEGKENVKTMVTDAFKNSSSEHLLAAAKVFFDSSSSLSGIAFVVPPQRSTEKEL